MSLEIYLIKTFSKSDLILPPVSSANSLSGNKLGERGLSPLADALKTAPKLLTLK